MLSYPYVGVLVLTVMAIAYNPFETSFIITDELIVVWNVDDGLAILVCFFIVGEVDEVLTFLFL